MTDQQLEQLLRSLPEDPALQEPDPLPPDLDAEALFARTYQRYQAASAKRRPLTMVVSAVSIAASMAFILGAASILLPRQQRPPSLPETGMTAPEETGSGPAEASAAQTVPAPTTPAAPELPPLTDPQEQATAPGSSAISDIPVIPGIPALPGMPAVPADPQEPSSAAPTHAETAPRPPEIVPVSPTQPVTENPTLSPTESPFYPETEPVTLPPFQPVTEPSGQHETEGDATECPDQPTTNCPQPPTEIADVTTLPGFTIRIQDGDRIVTWNNSVPPSPAERLTYTMQGERMQLLDVREYPLRTTYQIAAEGGQESGYLVCQYLRTAFWHTVSADGVLEPAQVNGAPGFWDISPTAGGAGCMLCWDDGRYTFAISGRREERALLMAIACAMYA